MLYVAVITGVDRITSFRSDGTFSCVIGEDEKETVGRGIELSKGWTNRFGHRYEVLAGTLTSKAVVPVKYKLVRI